MPASASMGVAAIDSATVVRSILHSCGAMRPLLSAIPSATNANSPKKTVLCESIILIDMCSRAIVCN